MRNHASAVIKLGGSLFGVPDLSVRLANFLSDFSRPRPVLVVGGGRLVDLLRNWDRIYAVGEEESHWLALRLLSINSEVAERLLPEVLKVARSPDDCDTAWDRGLIPVYDPLRYIVDIDERSRDPLPRRWRVTSDSIAASMALRFEAPELILLKSVSLPERLSMADAADEGIVDPHFPFVARHVPRVVCFNLRMDFQEEKILYAPES